MRFAPPNPLRIADRAGGLNQISIGSYNERLVLSLLLQNEGISRMEIGKKTGLSAQTVSVIVRSLKQEGLVAKGEARRGRVGPPTIPMSLNPDGAYSVGVSISYRKTDIVLIDFIGKTRYHESLLHQENKDEELQAICLESIQKAINTLAVKSRSRVAGIGLALPEGIDTWANSGMESANTLQNQIENMLGLPVFVQNDVTSAASGESMFGTAKTKSDYLFFFLGAQLHHRLVLNHQIYKGNHDLALKQEDVGILELEKQLINLQVSTDTLWIQDDDWSAFDQTIINPWLENCEAAVVHTLRSISQFIDTKTIVLSSYAPLDISRQICSSVEKKLPGIQAVTGDIIKAPKAIGAASLPFSSRFMVQ